MRGIGQRVGGVGVHHQRHAGERLPHPRDDRDVPAGLNLDLDALIARGPLDRDALERALPPCPGCRSTRPTAIAVRVAAEQTRQRRALLPRVEIPRRHLDRGLRHAMAAHLRASRGQTSRGCSSSTPRSARREVVARASSTPSRWSRRCSRGAPRPRTRPSPPRPRHAPSRARTSDRRSGRSWSRSSGRAAAAPDAVRPIRCARPQIRPQTGAEWPQATDATDLIGRRRHRHGPSAADDTDKHRQDKDSMVGLCPPVPVCGRPASLVCVRLCARLRQTCIFGLCPSVPVCGRPASLVCVRLCPSAADLHLWSVSVCARLRQTCIFGLRPSVPVCGRPAFWSMSVCVRLRPTSAASAAGSKARLSATRPFCVICGPPWNIVISSSRGRPASARRRSPNASPAGSMPRSCSTRATIRF